MNLRRTGPSTRKEMRHILRDARSLTMALAVPVLMLLLFGLALSLDVDHIPTMIYDADRTAKSRDLIDQFRGSNYFEILGYPDNYKTIEQAIDRNKILLGVVIPPDYSRLIGAGKEARVQLLIDGSDSNTASIALGYAESVVQSYSLAMRAEGQSRKGRERRQNRAARRFAAASLVQQPARIEELRGAGVDRGDPHDRRVGADVADSGSRVGDGDDGATALDATAADRAGVGQDDRLFRGGACGPGDLDRLRSPDFSGAAAGELSVAGADELPVSFRDAVLGYLFVRRDRRPNWRRTRWRCFRRSFRRSCSRDLCTPSRPCRR